MDEQRIVCKVVILDQQQSKRPKVHPINFLQKLQERRRKHPNVNTRRNLFGKANPDDTRRLLKEQYAIDQQRLFAKFGFDVQTIEELERCKNDARENLENNRNGQNVVEMKKGGCSVKYMARKILKARKRGAFKVVEAENIQNQKCITDFYQPRKSLSFQTKPPEARIEQGTLPETSQN